MDKPCDEKPKINPFFIFVSFVVLLSADVYSVGEARCAVHICLLPLQVLVPPRGFATFVTFILSQEGRGSNAVGSLRPQKNNVA